MPRRPALRLAATAAAALMTLALAGCSSAAAPSGSGQSGAQQTSDTAQQTSDTAQQATPAPVPGQEALHVSTYKVTGNERVVIKTSKGDITIRLYPKDAPNTVATFLELVSSGFYDGTTFHRVEPGFVIQGGDPLTKQPGTDPQLYGTGGPGFRLKAEFNQRKHDLGAVAMARSQDRDSAGSQFYITLAPQPMLDGQYTVFGQVVSGMDVVKRITKGDKMESVTIVRGQ